MHQLSHEETDWHRTKHPIILACDNWQDPRNIGMAFRLADAFGVQEIWLGGESPAPPNKKLSKAARSTDKWIPFRSIPDLTTAIKEAQTEGHSVWAIEITSSSKSIREFAKGGIPKPLIIVLGAESKGISAETLSSTDACCHIPMMGRNTSLNVATALAIALYEITNIDP